MTVFISSSDTIAVVEAGCVTFAVGRQQTGEKMKQLEIKWYELEDAFEAQSFEMAYYLDTETGEVLMILDEDRYHHQETYEKYADPDDMENFDIEAALAQSDLADWQKQQVLAVELVEAHSGGRVIAVPDRPNYEAYNEMQDFIYTIEDERLHNWLLDVTQGRGAFRRFRDVLERHPAERERWFAFRDNRLRQRILDWLEAAGIEPVEVPPPASAEVDQEAAQEAREKLLDEVVIFVRAARQIPGVLRIALIGSLTTDKVNPKDADLLVTVADDADLTRLATRGRKLQGHAQSFGRGGEVFLGDPQHNYLGRICPWKDCRPGIRSACDALHCGRREYLHDDLEAVRLSHDLVAEPPLELWPEVVARVAVPEDVAEIVLGQLQ